MYYSERNPLHHITRNSEKVVTAKGLRQRRLHKAFLRYHDPENWQLLRETLQAMGRSDLIGYGKKQLIPPRQPANWQSSKSSARSENPGKKFFTQHTGLPPRSQGQRTSVRKTTASPRKPH